MSKQISFVPVFKVDDAGKSKLDMEGSLGLVETLLNQFAETYDNLAEKVEQAVETTWEETLSTVEHMTLQGVTTYAFPLLRILPSPENIAEVESVIEQVMNADERFAHVGLGRDSGYWYKNRLKDDKIKARIIEAAKKTTERDAKKAAEANQNA